MLRTLLAERFQLKTHTEPREGDGYALVLTRPSLGPGLHPITIDCETNRLADGSKPGVFPADARLRCGMAIVDQRVNTRQRLVTRRQAAITMDELATGLWGSLGRPVIDKTGLAGTFDVELKYLTEQERASSLPPPQTPLVGVPLEDALKQQLGFELRRERTTVTMLVIDAVERPTPD